MGSIKSFKAANHHVLCCARPRKHVGIFLINQNFPAFNNRESLLKESIFFK